MAIQNRYEFLYFVACTNGNPNGDPDMGNMYQNSQAVIKVSAQATQVKNNGTDVFSAAGWPDTATDGE